MKKKLTIILPLLLMITLIIIGCNSEKVYADIKYDIGGAPSTVGGGGGGGPSSTYDLKFNTMIKVNLVDVSGSSAPTLVSSHYYIYVGREGNRNTWESYYNYLKNSNSKGSYNVCGKIGAGSYSSGCESIYGNYTETSTPWFLMDNAQPGEDYYYGGINASHEKIKNYLTNESNFEAVVNKTSISSIIGKRFDYATLTPEDEMNLKKYRIIIEPVYALAPGGGSGNFMFATIKGIATIMKDTAPSGNLSRHMGEFARNIFASNQHGSINRNGLAAISNEFYTTGANYYNTLSDVNSGYGYGIFYLVDGCDPSYECCYDDGGNFRDDYFGDTNNYKCNIDVGSASCPTDELEQCVSEPEEITPQECLSDTGTGSLPGTLNCTGADYYQVKNVSINDFEPGGIDTEKWRNFIKTKKGNSSNTGGCDSSVTVKISGKASIEQEGNVGFSLDNTTTYYAGGGFGFNITYSTNAKYSICNPGLEFIAKRQYASYSCESAPEDEYEFIVLDDGVDYDYDGYYDLIKKTEYEYSHMSGTTCYYDKTTKEIYLKATKLYIDDVWQTADKDDLEAEIKINYNYYCLNNWLYEDDYDDDDFTNEYDEFDCIRIDLGKMDNTEKTVIPGDPLIPEEDWDLEEVEQCFAYEHAYDNIYNCYEYKDEQINEDTIDEAAIESCPSEIAETYCAGNCLSTGDASGVNVSDEIKQVYEYMKDEYLNEVDLNDNSQVKSYDSNIVGNTYTSMQGIWNETYDGYDNLSDATEQSGVELWYPGQTINYTANYNLSQACIGLYPSLDMSIKSPVAYTGGTCSGIESATQKYLDGNNLYYIPLKQPTGSFPVKANTINTQGLSLVSNMSWDLDYSCSVNVEQRLYKTNGKYKFIYRPINRYDPFPNREEGSNWTNLKDNNSTVFNQKITEGRNNSNLEYEIRLTPQSIINLKNYTKSYNDMSTISKNGKSTILNNFSFNKRTNSYNDVGLCTNDCW